MAKSSSTKRMVFYAMMIAITAILQIVSNFVKFGPVSITLALVPIIVGAAIYGWRGGAVLGFVFGLVVYLTGLIGWDGGTVIWFSSSNGVISAIATPILVIVKGTVAGIVAGLIYEALEKKNSMLGVILAGIAAPVLNTGIFVLGWVTIFRNTRAEDSMWAAFVAILAAIAVNFIVELVANLALATVIERIIKIAGKHKFSKA